MQEITLTGGQLHITKDRIAYEVQEGTALVYLLPYQDAKPGRRKLIAELSAGERLPGFAHDSELLGGWRIGICALDKARIAEAGAADEELLRSFAQRIHLHVTDIADYDEELIEQYNLDLVKEEGYLYRSHKEREDVYLKGLRLIYHVFRPQLRSTDTDSGDALYDATAILCRLSDIPVADYAQIRECCGREFGLEDIARISHFVTRDITLEDGWFRQDAGPVLVYEAESGMPIACVPTGPSRYVAYRSKESRAIPVDAAFAATLAPDAQMFCRPFPNKVMTLKDLLLFGAHHVYRSDIIRLLVMMLLGTLVGLLLPWLNERLYDDLIPLGDAGGLIQVCLIVLACAVGNICFAIVENLATFRSISSMQYAVQTATFDRLFNLPERILDRYDAADLAMRAMGVSELYSTLAESTLGAVLTGVFSLLYLWRMFQYAPVLALVSLLLLAAVVAYLLWNGNRQAALQEQRVDEQVKARSVMHQTLHGIATIRIAGAEDRALYQYMGPYVKSEQINATLGTLSGKLSAVMATASIAFSMLFYYLIESNGINMSVGAFMGFCSAFGSFSSAVLQAASALVTIHVAQPLYERCKPILENLPEYDENAALPGDLTGDIAIENVSFAYNEEDGNILHQISLHVKPGEYVGIVGASGCGKSTLLKLLLGFEQPQIGKIYYDGQDMDGLDKRELRRRFGVVLQDGGLIPGSILENITITAPDTSPERVMEVLEEVGLAEDVAEMPMGIFTMLSEDSGMISGGQKQRILIARAIVGKPQILYMDEATSALDNVTQAQVTASLDALHVTRVVIAHRLSTVIHCDRIVVMNKGQIVEEGTYEELMERKGWFYELAIRQIS